MARIWSTELPAHAGESVQLSGWLHRFRQLSLVSFLILRDGRGLAQVVIEDAALIEKLAVLPAESVLRVEGEAVAVLQAPGGIEVRGARVEGVSEAEAPPFDLHRPTIKALLPTVLDHAAVALRHPRRRALQRVMAASAEGYRAALRAQGFVEVFTPKIVGSATESGANVFALDYFGRPAYLAQSPQLYKQMMVGVFERVFEAGPVFRAEPSDTPRHLSEYVSLDFEMGFVRDHTEVMDTLTEVLREMVRAVQAQAADAVELPRLELPEVPAVIPSIHFSEAQRLLAAELGEDGVVGEPDLAPAHERWLGEWARREHGSEFLFVTGYPSAKRPFYTAPEPGRPEYTNSFDLLFRGLELVTGGQRLHRHRDYVAALEARGMDPEPFEGYLEAFKHGMPPHGGCALGLERWVARLAGVANVRETTLFPRDVQRLTP